MWEDENKVTNFGVPWSSAYWTVAGSGAGWNASCWSTASSGEAWSTGEWSNGDAWSGEYRGTTIPPCEAQQDDSLTTSLKKKETETTKKMNKMMKKTKMCSFYMYGKCTRGEECMYAHNSLELQGKPNLRKTSLCPQFMESGYCEWMSNGCEYAHGLHELRGTTGFFKTKMCPLVSCDQGPACRYAHHPSELRERNGSPHLGDNGSQEPRQGKFEKKADAPKTSDMDKKAVTSEQPRRSVGKETKERTKKNVDSAPGRIKKDLSIELDEKQYTKDDKLLNGSKLADYSIAPEPDLSLSHHTAEGSNSNDDESSWYQKRNWKEKTDAAELPTVAATPTSVNEFSTLNHEDFPASSEAQAVLREKELIEKLTIWKTRQEKIQAVTVEPENRSYELSGRPESSPWEKLDFTPRYVTLLRGQSTPEMCTLPKETVATICSGTDCVLEQCATTRVCLAARRR